jgi:2-phosphosulfolactate phosphatase
VISGNGPAAGVRDELGQRDAAVRFEWGPAGAEQLRDEAGCLFIVDVLSFTTAVSIAVGRRMTILPHRSGDGDAEEFAASHYAMLAVRRTEVSADRPWSLSPAGLARAPVTSRLVLPSPNGSAIAATSKGPVLAACLRNATASARWALEHGFGTDEHPAVVIAAGERWPDGSLRPALEDALGAGAVLSHLEGAGCELSVEAAAIAQLPRACHDVRESIRSCGSALELARAGYLADVEAAIEVDGDEWVAVLEDGAFNAG